MEKLTTKQRLLLIGLLFIEAIIMFWTVPKANADDIDVQLWLIIDISLALIISLAVIIKGIVSPLYQFLSYVLPHIFRYYIAPRFMIGES